MNGESKMFSQTLFMDYQGKMVELYDTELSELEAGRLRIHRAPHACRFLGCKHADWYISDRVLAFHERKRVESRFWKMPTSCPEHRNISKQLHIAKTNTKLCPTSKKRSFDTENDALFYASTLATKQFVYKCDNCDDWHLTSLSPAQVADLEDRKKQREREAYIGDLGQKIIKAQSEPEPAAVAPAITTPESAELAVCRMYRDGAHVSTIASDLHVSAPKIYEWLKKHNVPMRRNRKPSGMSASPFKPPVDLEAEEARITAQLEGIKRKRQMMEEAKRLRVEQVGANGFRIMKEGEHATLTLNDLEPLIDQLMALVPQPVQ
jgi:hypothetical protein